MIGKSCNHVRWYNKGIKRKQNEPCFNFLVFIYVYDKKGFFHWHYEMFLEKENINIYSYYDLFLHIYLYEPKFIVFNIKVYICLQKTIDIQKRDMQSFSRLISSLWVQFL